MSGAAIGYQAPTSTHRLRGGMGRAVGHAVSRWASSAVRWASVQALIVVEARPQDLVTGIHGMADIIRRATPPDFTTSVKRALAGA